MDMQKVEIVVAAGGTTTKEYERLKQRWEMFQSTENDVLAQLTDAVLGEATPEEIAELRTLSNASEGVTTVHSATVRNHVLKQLNMALADEYDTVAEANYDAIRKNYNKAAAAFTKAHNIVPATTDPAQLVTSEDKIRKAWADGQALNVELRSIIPTLVTAAELGGKRITNPASPLGLIAKLDGLHRRRVWEAWDEGFTELLTLGATLEAGPLGEYTEYREPAPMEKRHVRGDIGFRNVDFDPEDEVSVPGGKGIPAELGRF